MVKTHLNPLFYNLQRIAPGESFLTLITVIQSFISLRQGKLPSFQSRELDSENNFSLIHQWHFHSVIHLMAESLIGSGGGILIQAGAEIFLFAPLGMVTEVSISCPPGCLRWSWGGFPPGGVKVLLDVINDLSLVCLLIIFGIAPLLPSLIKLWGRDPKSGMKKFFLLLF